MVAVRHLSMLPLLLALLASLTFAVADDDQIGRQKLEELLHRSQQRPFMIFNSDDFRKYVGDAPRPYDIVTFLTSKTGSCIMCNEMRPEVELAANAFEAARYTNDSLTPNHQVFFAELDGSRNYELFQQLGLQTVPHLVFVERQLNNKRKKWEKLLQDKLSMNRGLNAESILKSLGSRTPVRVPFQRPPTPIDWTFLLLLLVGVSSVVAFCVSSFGRPYVDYLRNNRWIYLMAALAFYLFCTAGGMYNHIQNTPFSQQNNDGSHTFIAGGSGTQFGAETWIIGFINLACAVALIVLNTRLLKVPGASRGVIVIIGIMTFMFFFSQLRTIYTRKNYGYQFGYLWRASDYF